MSTLSSMSRLLCGTGVAMAFVAGCTRPVHHHEHAASAANKAGIAHAERHDLAAAEQAFRQAVAADPHHAAAHNNLGRVLAMQGRVREAAEQFQRAFDAAPLSTIPSDNLSVLLEAMGWPLPTPRAAAIALTTDTSPRYRPPATP